MDTTTPIMEYNQKKAKGKRIDDTLIIIESTNVGIYHPLEV